MKQTSILILTAAILASCSGEDRSGEVPFAPTVRTIEATALGTAVTLTGEVLASPNSRLTAQGFYYGNDTLRVEVLSPLSGEALFSETVDNLEPGDYYAHAFATNGIGTASGDTIFFSISE